jgi:hypothetical protein
MKNTLEGFHNGHRLRLMADGSCQACAKENARRQVSADMTRSAAALGRKGGAVSSAAKTEAARLNGLKGGRPSRRSYGSFVCSGIYPSLGTARTISNLKSIEVLLTREQAGELATNLLKAAQQENEIMVLGWRKTNKIGVMSTHRNK